MLFIGYILPCILFISCAFGNKRMLLEKKIYGLETSMQQDIHILRNYVEQNTAVLQDIIQMLNSSNTVSEENILETVSGTDNIETSKQIEFVEKCKQITEDMTKVKLAFSDEKRHFRKFQEMLEIKFTALKSSLNRQFEDMNEKLDNNVELINEKMNRTLDNILQRQLEFDAQIDALKSEFKYTLQALSEDLKEQRNLHELDLTTMLSKANATITQINELSLSLQTSNQNVADLKENVEVLNLLCTNVTLVNGSSKSGRVEVLYDGIWGTVCDDYFEDVDARVLCRSLGFAGGVAKGSAFFGQGSGVIWLDHVQCTGSETNIFACPANPIGSHNCVHSEDVGVVCS